jgi:hypothetical protein
MIRGVRARSRYNTHTHTHIHFRILSLLVYCAQCTAPPLFSSTVCAYIGVSALYIHIYVSGLCLNIYIYIYLTHRGKGNNKEGERGKDGKGTSEREGRTTGRATQRGRDSEGDRCAPVRLWES